MKSKYANSPLDHNFVIGRPTSGSFAVSEAMRQTGRPLRNARVRFIEPDSYAEFSQPRNTKGVNVLKVDHLKGDKRCAALVESKVKRFPITVVDRKTGEQTEVLAKLEMREIVICSYGTVFSFSCKAGSQSAVDSRSGKRVSLDFVKSETTRILGSEGEAKFAEFAAPKS